MEDIFRFILAPRLKDCGTIFTATKLSNHYIVAWENNNGEENSTDYYIEDVENIVADGDWIIVD